MRRIVCVLFLVGVFSTNSVCGETLSEYRENLYDLFIQQKIPQWGAVLSKMSADKSCGTLGIKFAVRNQIPENRV